MRQRHLRGASPVAQEWCWSPVSDTRKLSGRAEVLDQTPWRTETLHASARNAWRSLGCTKIVGKEERCSVLDFRVCSAAFNCHLDIDGRRGTCRPGPAPPILGAECPNGKCGHLQTCWKKGADYAACCTHMFPTGQPCDDNAFTSVFSVSLAVSPRSASSTRRVLAVGASPA